MLCTIVSVNLNSENLLPGGLNKKHFGNMAFVLILNSVQRSPIDFSSDTGSSRTSVANYGSDAGRIVDFRVSSGSVHTRRIEHLLISFANSNSSLVVRGYDYWTFLSNDNKATQCNLMDNVTNPHVRLGASMINTMARPMIQCDFQRHISYRSYADLKAQMSQISILYGNDSELVFIFLVKLD